MTEVISCHKTEQTKQYTYVLISLTTRIKNLVHNCTFEQGALLIANRNKRAVTFAT